MATLKNTTIDDTGYLKVPVGTEAQRPETPYSGSIRFNEDSNNFEVYTGNNWKYIDLSTIPPTYNVSDSNSTVDEGTTITFDIITTNVENNTILYYTLSGVDSNDTSTPLSGNVTIIDNTGSVNVLISNDETTEGSEIITFQLRVDSITGEIVASDTTTINDTSVYTAMAATGGTETTTTINGYPYKVHTFSSTGTSNFVVTTPTAGAVFSPEIFMWGAGGGGGHDRGARGNQYFTGGGGASIYAKLELNVGTYTISVGGAGGGASAGCLVGTGGGSAGISSTGHTGGRGGHPATTGCSSPGGGGGAGTALLDGNTELLVAGGGGGGGGVETGSIGSGGRGGGGGQNGENGSASAIGGASGAQSNGVGATPGTPSADQSNSGAGGGGYRGGNGGSLPNQDSVAAAGGGGGSNYITPTALTSTISNGNFITPGDSTNTLRGTAGNGGAGGSGTAGGAGTNGLVVIRYRTA